MNTPFKATRKLLLANVLLAIASIANTQKVQAACVDNGSGTLTCSGVSDNTNSLLNNRFILDDASNDATLNITTIDSLMLTTPAVLDADGNELLPAEYGVVVRNNINTVNPTSLISANFGQSVIINNLGAKIDVHGRDPLTYTSLRLFDPASWTNDANGLLYNGGELAGYAAAIYANANTQSLTVNNLPLNNAVYNPANFTYGTNGIIAASGDYSAAILTNSPLLTLNNNGLIDDVVSFAGAIYTPPVSGSSDAVLVSAGQTVINNGSDNAPASIRDVYVVDRNPLLAAAQNDNPALTLAYTIADVGPRNSTINNYGVKYAFSGSSLNNVYLGSGIHTVNNSYSYIANIYVDQREVDVVDVTGGVATTLYQVHGGREFTLNHSQANTANTINSVIINDVAGAKNTINLFGSDAFNTNLLTNGLGDNVVNYTCDVQQACAPTGSVVGFKEMSFAGSSFSISQSLGVTGDINISANHVYLNNPPVESGLPPTTLTANNVIVGVSGRLEAERGDANNPHTVLLGDQRIGQIEGNLINKGVVNIGNATLNVSGTASMETGSRLLLAIGPGGPGQLNSAGTTFDSNSTLVPIVKLNVRLLDGDSFIAATNVTGTPTIQNSSGFLQWLMSQNTGDLVLTADIGVPDFLKTQLTPAANNAVAAFFSNRGDDYLSSKLQTELLGLRNDNVISAAERLHPEINDGAIRMVLGNTDKLFGILDSRLLDTYLNASKQPSASTETTDEKLVPSKSIWVQGFGDRGSQETLQGADGYGMSSAGMAMGFDKEIDADGNTRIGFAFGYARGNITNSGNTVNNRIDTNSYLATVYGSHNLTDWYINGAVGIGRNTYDTRRQLIDHSGIANHDSWQFSTRVDAGWPLMIDDSVTVVPIASLDYTHLKESGYKENGTVNRRLTEPCTYNPDYTCAVIVNGVEAYSLDQSPINLAVARRSLDSIRTGLGAKAIYSLQQKDWGAELELHGIYRHEFGNIAQDSKASFVVGSNSFNSPGVNPIRDDFILGGSLRLTGDDENDQLTLLTSYDANIRQKYFGQTMTLNLRYDFDQAPRYLKKAKEKLALLKAKNAPEQQISATEQDIAEIQKAMQAELVINATNPADAAKQKAIDATLNTWASALSNKNLDVYFNTYAANFETPDGTTRQQWERKRKSEISKEPNPAIRISYLTIEPKGDKAMAVFTQTQLLNAQQEAVQKILDLENKNGRWLIVREDSIAITD